MKIFYLLGIIIVLIITIVTVMNVNLGLQSNDLSALSLANVEALAGENDCNNTNGYRSWSTSSMFGSKKEFYDCCTVLRQGYSPEGNCN
jgi:hypothetical protein